ncbi:TPA: hypothetical protein ACH3X1_003468 [Trebouxia sp. C0004]
MVPLWLLQVAHQLPRCHKDPVSLLAAGKWMSAPELVHVIDTAWRRAELDLQQAGDTVQTSRQLHDAALASVTFSHLPPIRLSCIRALVAPSYQGPCLHPDCKLPGCEGNRLYIITTSPLLMRIKLPHHKNACKWGQASIEFDLPAELAELLYTYLGESRRALLDHHLLIGQSCTYVFMDMHAELSLLAQPHIASAGTSSCQILSQFVRRTSHASLTALRRGPRFMWLDNSDFLGPFMRKLFLITEDSMHLMRRETFMRGLRACIFDIHQPDVVALKAHLTKDGRGDADIEAPPPKYSRDRYLAYKNMLHMQQCHVPPPPLETAAEMQKQQLPKQAGKAGRSKKDTAVARTRSQQAGKQSAKKEAEITESEPSGNEHDRSGGLLKPVAMSVRVISAPSLKTRSLLRPDE